MRLDRLLAVAAIVPLLAVQFGAVAYASTSATSTSYSIGTSPWPYGIAVVQSGVHQNKVWVAAREDSVVDTSGALFGPASSGSAFPVTGSIANSALPYSVAVNNVGTAFVPGSQFADRRVYAIQPDGSTTSYATTNPTFSITMGETDDIVYLLQQGGRIEKLDVSTGTKQRSDLISNAWDIAFSPANGGRIAVSRYGSDQVSVFDTSLSLLATYTVGDAPAGITFDADGNIYTANTGGQDVSRISTDGTVDATWATTGRANSDIVQGVDGGFYVSGSFGNVARISAEGAVFATWGATSSGDWLKSIAAAPDGNIWVASDRSKKVLKFSPPAAAAPGVPGNVQLTPANQSITVSWNPAYDNGSAVTEYQYSFDGSTGWTKLADPNVGQATVTGLNNGTTYNIYVRAVNSVGPGNAAAPKSATPAQVPAQPTDLSASAANTSVNVSFTAGSDGGSPITNYQYQLDAGAWTALDPADTSSPITIDGLTNGTAYSIKIRAVNTIGSGAESSAVVAAPQGPPDAPTALAATPLDGAAQISFTPGNDGGSAITDYEYQVGAGAWQSAGVTTGPITISGLNNGDTYLIKLRAVSNLGSGTASGTVSVTPRTTPAAPTALSAAPVDSGAEISFTPGNDGGSAITDYEYQVDAGAWASAGVTTSPLSITGLVNGNTYSIKIRAVNNAGEGAESASVSVTPESTPSAPTGLSATAQDQGASISFTPGSDGGSVITDYEYQLDGGMWQSANTASSPVVITGLTNGTTYSVKIRAINGIGDGKGAASSAVSVTPVSSLDPPGAPTAVESVPGNGSLDVTWEAPSQGGAPITDYEYSTDGTTWINFSSTSTSATISNDSSGTPLVNGQAYTVRIRAKNTNGPGPGSTGVSQTPGIPLAPSGTTSAWNESALSLQWTPGSDNGDPISEYRVVVSPLSSRSGLLMMRTGPGTYTTTSTSTTIPGLDPSSGYTITLSGRNSHGWGLPTSFTVSGSGEVEGERQTPAAIIQQVGLPPSGKCEDVIDGLFGSQTLLHGGWGKSWAPWMNGGLGGAVCTRMMVYSNSQGRWVLAE